MSIPRFQLRTMMIVVAIIALWLASFGMPVGPGGDLRTAMRLMLLVGSVSATVFFRGAARAFWFGFVIVVLLITRPFAWGGNFHSWFIPSNDWSTQAADRGCELLGVAPTTPTGSSTWSGIRDTTELISLCILAALGGRVSMLVYRRANREAAK